jgi:hypothetical protein
MTCETAEFLIDDRGEPVERGSVSATPGAKQSADLTD